MKRSSFGWVLLSLALAFCSFVGAGVARVADYAVSTYRAVKKSLVDGFMQVMATDEPAKASTVWFVRAKAFVARIVKRERPVVTNDWRMCPST